jgi:hypothetical protein
MSILLEFYARDCGFVFSWRRQDHSEPANGNLDFLKWTCRQGRPEGSQRASRTLGTCEANV